MFKPCVIIPVYNHSDFIAQIVTELNSQQLDCFLIDDGSTQHCHNLLEQVATSSANAQLLTLPRNSGKGAAVCQGLEHVYQQGYSHALQIDADGQHNLNDVPQFLALSQQHPAAIISAARPYQQMPAKRRYGRIVTDLWVWINTLSLNIKDSMCGFRLYPLAATHQLLQQQSVCSRMDFDTDIIVRLYWQGLDVLHIATDIRYDSEITSHFQLWQDNLRISLMHSKLFFGMLVRSPKLLKRHFG